ncbi:acetyltransferase [Flagellimonas sediminis]|uniref:Transferase n=1 Tax=Flagellimonas sediminis TaxID=2696468 RepID=A0A6I5KZ05_9FLAO|nr:acetyltransferase [Allomuricauda sediminis]NDV42681.1 transferase [Allomuricauda sediminis]
MEEVVIFGASGHGKVTIDILECMGNHEIIGFLDANKQQGTQVLGYPVFGGMEQVPELLQKKPDLKFFVAIGDNWARYNVIQQLKNINSNVSFVNAIHPNAIIGKGVKLGTGIMIMAGSIVNTDSSIGNFTIVNTRSSVGHESCLMEFSSLAPNTTLAGNVEIGAFSAISMSTTILNRRKIGEHTVVGAGSLVTKDVKDHAVYYGIPAVFIRSRNEGDKYL